MKRFANETSLHGVKEVWYTSRIGRMFWFVVFSCCFAFMIMQLKGVFEGYISEHVGTKTTYTSMGAVVEVPSLYYCSPRWKATPGDLEELIRCSKKFEKKMSTRRPPLSLVEQQMQFREECYAAFIRVSLSEEVINTIINPDWVESMYAKHYLSPKTCPQGYAEEMENLYKSNPDLFRKLTKFETEVTELTMQAFKDDVNQGKDHLENLVDKTEEHFENGIKRTTELITNRLANLNEHFENSIDAVKAIVAKAQDITDNAIAFAETELADITKGIEESIKLIEETAAKTKELIQGKIGEATDVVNTANELASKAIETAEAAVKEALVKSTELVAKLGVELDGKLTLVKEELAPQIATVASAADAAKDKAYEALNKANEVKAELARRAAEAARKAREAARRAAAAARRRCGRVCRGRKKRNANSLNGLALNQMHNWILELLEDIQTKFNGSVKNYVEQISMIDVASEKRPAHGVITNRSQLSIFASVDEKVLMDNYRWGKVAVNMNGVCWDVNAGAEPRTVQEVQTHEYSHYVIHFGAFSNDMGILTKDTDTEAKYAKDYNFNLGDAVYFTTKEHPNASCDGDFREPYETDLFISQQNKPVPFFKNRIRLSGNQHLVHIRFSTKTTNSINRKGYHCRHWSILDKAHCIEEKRWMQELEPRCRQYLPASEHYPETQITNETCYHTPMKEIKEMLEHHSPTTSSDYQAKEFFEQMSAEQDTLVDWMKLYNADDNDCPTPCSETEYVITTTYSPADDGICNEVVGHVLLKDKYAALLEEKNETVAREKQRALQKFVKLDRQWSDPPRPCTKVIIAQTEELGILSEEYLLHSFADVVANLGGTLGFWMGASILSFVQCLYFMCLERLLTAGKKTDDI